MLTSGTGVGGAVIAGDRLLRGGFGVAGELGHMRIVPDGILCGCGARGCIEQYGSGRALQRMANAIADAGGIGRGLAAARTAAGGELEGAVIGKLVQEGDPGANAAIAELGSWLGQACASLAVVLDPQIFVIGGGVASAGERLLGPVRQAFSEHLPARGFHPEPVFAVAELGNEAGVVGAADLARLHDDPSYAAFAPRG
jgi:glucokinase